MSTVIPIGRRGFLGSVFSAGALVLAAQVLPSKALGTPAAAEGAAAPWYPSVSLGIEPTGTVTIAAHRSEMCIRDRYFFALTDPTPFIILGEAAELIVSVRNA